MNWQAFSYNVTQEWQPSLLMYHDLNQLVFIVLMQTFSLMLT